MITIQGKGISKGVAKGQLYFFRRPEDAVTKKLVENIGLEQARLDRALAESVRQLEALADGCRETAPEMAALFETHAMLVEDEDFLACIQSVLEEESCCAEYAVERAGESFAALFSDMDDDYMHERAADVKDIARRIQDNLRESAPGGIHLERPVILCADDLMPSETLQLDRTRLLGIVIKRGSEHSHTAILARAMGIPAICAVGEAMGQGWDGCLCGMDGETGELVLDPDADALTVLERKLASWREQKGQLEGMKGQADTAPDGRKIALCCNISAPEEVAAVLEHDGRGVGLFRSEFLYLKASDYPTEEAQFEAYRAAAAAMEGKRVVIRTMDVGADKQTPYLELEQEANPALGMRGVRVSLSRPEMFRTQLRALYRASAYGNLAILFPMITSRWEVRACKRICREVMAELDAEGIPYNKTTEVGIMIETPAAVLVAEDLAPEVDFFSVGTNDLTQYILACDRQAGHLERFCDPHHPAVLRAVKMAADAAHGAGIWIGICGELAADVSLLPKFLDMGVDELSVAPASVLPLRAALRGMSQ